MVRTFLDAGVLIAAARGVGTDAERAVHVLEDPNRVFVASSFLHLELVPKAVFHRRYLERDFYARYFREADFVDDLSGIIRLASNEAERAGLAAMDALHVAAAQLGGCQEFITTEKRNSPLHRCGLLNILYLYDPSS